MLIIDNKSGDELFVMDAEYKPGDVFRFNFDNAPDWGIEFTVIKVSDGKAFVGQPRRVKMQDSKGSQQ